MNPFSIKFGILISIISHIFIGIVFSFSYWLSSSDTELNFLLEKGSSSRIVARFVNKGLGDEISKQSLESQLGSTDVENDIESIQRKIIYPASALERNLESDCEWLVTVAENRKLEKLETTKKCKYGIFEKAFEDAVRDWEFASLPGTVIRIPVSFRIDHGK
ncbi:LIC_10042 family TonB-like protein [Leptospira sp. GIMC2001]|uniref:LIC_10042 family TonB-like protein n=1 Tax=Leptospira sp. GIMC2001 TaxID=1513297 RepID=UPI00234B687B|nr:hypothetical protein [Leptospira sp. GIMC2001]WCL49402.1 hypothetical protein O4O04_19245 [Leptospira sp. GIMC2001]